MSHFGRYIFIFYDDVGVRFTQLVSNSIKLLFLSCMYDLYLQLSVNGTQQFMKYRCARAMNVPQIKNAPFAIVTTYDVMDTYYFML